MTQQIRTVEDVVREFRRRFRYPEGADRWGDSMAAHIRTSITALLSHALEQIEGKKWRHFPQTTTEAQIQLAFNGGLETSAQILKDLITSKITDV